MSQVCTQVGDSDDPFDYKPIKKQMRKSNKGQSSRPKKLRPSPAKKKSCAPAATPKKKKSPAKCSQPLRKSPVHSPRAKDGPDHCPHCQMPMTLLHPKSSPSSHMATCLEVSCAISYSDK